MEATDATPKILSAAELLAADDLPERMIFVPQWQGSVRVRALSLAQQDHIRKSAMSGGKLDNEKMQTLMVIHCMTEPRLTEADYDRLRQKNAFALDLVAAEIMELSGISSDALRRARASFLSGAEGPGVVSAGRGAGVPVFAGADAENDGRGIDPAADDGGMGGVGSVPGSGE